jgi:diguanylate cyclase (GGDEF)-like protein
MPTILVVDDIIDNIQLLAFNLEDDGYNVITAVNGAQAIAATEQHRPDLILLDIMLPDIDGLHVTRLLKANEELKHIPIILVTSMSEDSDVALGLDAGAHDYVTKPINYTILSARMRTALREKALQDMLTASNADLHRLATTDGLTDITNRRYFLELSEREYVRAQRHDTDLCLILLDIDHFKLINDNQSHAAGDEALKVLAKTLTKELRSIDIIGRYGGEEFIVCLPDTDLETCITIANRLKEEIARTIITYDNYSFSITASLGIAVHNKDTNLETLINQADNAMYKAKDNGRNQVQVYQEK